MMRYNESIPVHEAAFLEESLLKLKILIDKSGERALRVLPHFALTGHFFEDELEGVVVSISAFPRFRQEQLRFL